MAKQEKGSKQPAHRIRIRLKGCDERLVDRSTKEIIETAKRTGARVAGPIPLPTRRQVYTVLRSPHVDRKSREQFEMRIHKRLIELIDPPHSTIGALGELTIPGGVDVGIKSYKSRQS